jgi:hypothetical protein
VSTPASGRIEFASIEWAARYNYVAVKLTSKAWNTNGAMDKFVTWSDNPGLVLSCVDASDLPEGKLTVYGNSNIIIAGHLPLRWRG